MNISRKYFLFGLGLILLSSFISQAELQHKAKYSPYYHQKKSMFEKLPDTTGEIIFLGDSITDGCNWTELFQDIRVKNRGISGDITDGILARLSEVTAAKPAKIFLMIGVNDLAIGKSVAEIVTNIQIIVKKIGRSSQKTQIYLQSLLPVNPDLGMFPDHTDKTAEIMEINKRLQVLSEKYALVYVDLFPAFAGKDNKLKPAYTNDGLHLTGSAYLLWRSQIKQYVK